MPPLPLGSQAIDNYMTILCDQNTVKECHLATSPPLGRWAINNCLPILCGHTMNCPQLDLNKYNNEFQSLGPWTGWMMFVWSTKYWLVRLSLRSGSGIDGCACLQYGIWGCLQVRGWFICVYMGMRLGPCTFVRIIAMSKFQSDQYKGSTVIHC